MGFLSGIFGGSKSTGSSSSLSGYSSLPENIRQGFDKLGLAASQYTDPNDPAALARFTPLAQTNDETTAYNRMREGFTPTEQSLRGDMSMLMNPYNDYVIGGMNNEAQGKYSILKQALNEAGQFGSNRQELGANDIELQRENQIGSMLQNQYNTALGQVFNNLVPQRQQDATNLLGIGEMQRNLDMQTKQAPIEALRAGTSMIAPFNSSTSNSYNSSNTSPGILSAFASGAGGGSGAANFLSTVGGMASGIGKAISPIASGVGRMFMSDEKLKENLELIGVENGHNIYEFNYIGKPEKWRGVIAQEVMEKEPAAVVEAYNGFYAVNYDKLGIEFRRAV